MGQFIFKLIEDFDFDILLKWWNDWGFPVPPKSCLPKNGLLISDLEGPLYAGFIYFTDANIAWVEWVVSNKNAMPSRKKGALKFMMDLFGQMANEAGVRYLYTSTVRPEFVNSLNKCGFQTGDTNVFQLIKNL